MWNGIRCLPGRMRGTSPTYFGEGGTRRGPRAGAKPILAAVRAACPGRGPRVGAGGAGVRLALQLDLGDPLRDARLPVPAFPDRAAALAAVAPGRVVRGRGVRGNRGGHDRASHPYLAGPVRLFHRGGEPG